MVRNYLLIVCIGLALTGCGLFGSAGGDPTAVPVEPAPTVVIDTGGGDTGGGDAGGGAPSDESTGDTGYPAPAETGDPVPPEVETPAGTLTVVGLNDFFPIAAPAGSNLHGGETVNHTVSQGEWLLQIARCYGASYSAVLQANPAVGNPNMILPGSVVVVPNVGSEGAINGAPCVQQHAVLAGETWESLGQQFGTDAATLQRANPGALTAGRTVFVPNMSVTVGQLPALSHDLLFIDTGDLVIYKGAVARGDKLPSDAAVATAAVGGNGRFVLSEQFPDPANRTVSEIALVDFSSNSSTILESNVQTMLPQGLGSNFTPYHDRLIFSPDGQWGAYYVSEADGYRLTTFPTSNPAAKKSVSGITHGLDIAQAFIPQLAPGHDAAHFLWSDNSGIYEMEYGLAMPEQLLLSTAGEGDTQDGVHSYEVLGWSPQGRYLLLLGRLFEGAFHYVLDVEARQVEMLPDSLMYVSTAVTSWQQDGTAVVISPPASENSGPKLAVYQPDGSSGTLVLNLVRETTIELAEPLASAPISFSAPMVQPFGGKVVFGLQIETPSSGNNGFWLLEDGATSPTRLNTMPDRAYHLVWAPSNAGVVVDNSYAIDGAPSIYVPFDGSDLFSLSDWLGKETWNFVWIVSP